MIRKHTEGMRPPRALYVPFELGRPFGAPNEPEFQRRVLIDALKLLERSDGPLIEVFNEMPPNNNASNDEIDKWICPVNFNIAAKDISDIEALAIDLKQEIALLHPWYRESIKKFNGRRLDGLTDFSPEEIVDLLVGFLKNPLIESFLADKPIGRALKLAADDLKHFYFQSAMARPKNISDGQLGDWFYEKTLAGRLLIQLRFLCLEHESEELNLIGRTHFVPNAMLKHI